MGAVRTIEDFIRQRMSVDGCRQIAVRLRNDGRFDAAIVHRDGSTATCDVSEDAADALWNVLVPYTMRRTLPSGRSAVIEGVVHGVDSTDVTDDDGLLEVDGDSHAPADDFEDLLG